MEPTVAVTKVYTFNNPQAAIFCLSRAADYSENVMPRSAMRTLAHLTTMAHPMGAEGDIGGAVFLAADLERLERLGFIRLSENGTIHLA